MKSEEIQGILWIAVAGVISFFSLRLPLEDTRRTVGLPGPGFFPLLLGVLLALLGVLLLVKSWIERRKAVGHEKGPSGEGAGLAGFWANKKPFSVLAGLIIYSAILERLGFLLSTFLFLILLLRSVARQKWTLSIITALSISLLSYLIFEVWLKAQLPPGIFRL
jgi:putative tricarboxylic transport membrane protein